MPPELGSGMSQAKTGSARLPGPERRPLASLWAGRGCESNHGFIANKFGRWHHVPTIHPESCMYVPLTTAAMSLLRVQNVDAATTEGRLFKRKYDVTGRKRVLNFDQMGRGQY